MTRTTALLVGGATAVALALGSLVGGVLAESRPSSPPVASAAQGVLAEHALTGAAGGITASTVALGKSRCRPVRMFR